MSYTAGDIDIAKLEVRSARGVMDMKNTFVRASIYESVFTPGILADIRVFDQNDDLGRLALNGSETVQFDFSVRGSQRASMTFALFRLNEVESAGSQKSKMYTLRCVSQEAMTARTNYVSKSYDQLCSEMVRDIHVNYLRSNKPLIAENTRGAQRIVIPNRSPYEAINLIRSRSVSPDYQSSFYVYFENRRNERQTFNFATFELLFSADPTKSFIQSDAINTDFRRRVDDNILSYKVAQQFSATDRIDLGGPQNLIVFNWRDGSITRRVVNPDDNQFRDGGSGTLNTPEFRNRYFNNVEGAPPPIVMFEDTSQRPSSYLPESSPNFTQYVALLMQNAMKIRVIGDTTLTAGITIDCTIPNKRSFTDGGSEDNLISGKFLVTRIHHDIAEAGERPRYTCVIEGVKGRYEEGV